MPDSNLGHLAQRTELSLCKGLFSAAASVTTGSEQFIPAGGGAVTSVSIVNHGIPVPTVGPTITEYIVRFTGDAANVGGQTMTPKLYYYRSGSATLIPTSAGAAMATTAGVQSQALTLTTPFQPAEGDVILASLTPSAGLTAAVTGVSLALG